MKAAFLTAIRELEIREVPDPKIQAADEVLLRIDTVGICGSDVHYYNEGNIGSLVVEYPCMTGHECGGTVAEVGGGVTGLKVGDRVAVDPLITCGKCDQCVIGRRHTCRNQRFLACPGQAPGAIAELLVMPQDCCYVIPDSVSFEEAALCEPLAIGVYAHALSGMAPAHTAAILGSGSIGLCVLAAIRAAADSPVYMTDLLAERVAFAKNYGANWAGNPEKEDIVAAILEHQPKGLDIVFECAGEQDTIDQAVDLLKPGGRLMLVGIPETPRISVVIDVARRHELTIQNVRRQNECVQPAIDLIASGRIDVKPLATHRFTLDQTKEAFDLVLGYSDGVIKAMVEVGDR